MGVSNQQRTTRPPNPSNYGIVRLLVVGLMFHLVFIGSVFDCYFTSPVVTGMKGYAGRAEAKRLVLFVGDGLRADSLFNVDGFKFVPGAPSIVAPYLRSIINDRGAFGVSHTRVPTESRPGHVAMIGGVHEYISSVAVGWEADPVIPFTFHPPLNVESGIYQDFDSVFNQSSFTFAFGAPEILSIFTRGATSEKVQTRTLQIGDEDFTKDASALDMWVLDQLRTLFRNATTDSNLKMQLGSDKVVFFLHLPGIDFTGHSYRPHSKEYMNNIRVVDNIVKDAEKLMHEFYQDDETSYIFTSDHGMSVIGNHGDGDIHNTRTPLIAWGRGIRGPLPDSSPSSHDSYSDPWRLNHLLRRDVDQADIVAIMASLLGVTWPVNSVGVLPDVDLAKPGYLKPKSGNEALAQLSLINAQVILEHYRVKHNIKDTQAIFYKPFMPLEEVDSNHRTPRRLALLSSIEQLLAEKNWQAARKLSAQTIKLGLEGLWYLQTYECNLIQAIATVAYIGWAANLSLFIFPPSNYTSQFRATSQTHWTFDIIALLIFLGTCALFAVQQSPPSFYLYITFPIYFWREFLLQAMPSLRVALRARQFPALIPMTRGVLTLLVVVGVIQGMVAGYTHRVVWSIGFVIAGVFWPLTWPKGVWKENIGIGMAWTLLCLVTSIFPLLSVERAEDLPSILAGGIVMLLAGWVSFVLLQRLEHDQSPESMKRLRASLLFQSTLIVLTMAVTASSVSSLQAKQGLPSLNHIMGWILLVSAPLYPFISKVQPDTRFSTFLTYFLGFGPCFIILSISIESVFYVVYSATLLMWLIVEPTIRHGLPNYEAPKTGNRNRTYSFQLDDLRIGLFFLFFVQVGFFGIGNVASISSFYLEPIFRLIPVYSPRLVATLLIFKDVAPYIILSSATALLNDALNMPPLSILLVALTLADYMTIILFFNVRDTGSWLEIGQSISHFCITSLLLVFSAGICAVGEYFLSNITRDHYKSE